MQRLSAPSLRGCSAVGADVGEVLARAHLGLWTSRIVEMTMQRRLESALRFFSARRHAARQCESPIMATSDCSQPVSRAYRQPRPRK